MIFILKIKKFTELLLEFIRVDYNNQTDKTNSFLYRVLGNDVDVKYSFFDNAVEIFTRTKGNDKRTIETRLGFDPDRATQPTIHVREPAKSKGKTDAIGFLSEDIYVNEDETISSRAKKSFTSRFELMITGANANEIILIQEVLEAAMLASFESLTIPFFELLDFSSKELIIQNESYGGRPLFVKSIELDCSFEKNNIPKLYTEENITTIQFENPEFLNVFNIEETEEEEIIE